MNTAFELGFILAMTNPVAKNESGSYGSMTFESQERFYDFLVWIYSQDGHVSLPMEYFRGDDGKPHPHPVIAARFYPDGRRTRECNSL